MPLLSLFHLILSLTYYSHKKADGRSLGNLQPSDTLSSVSEYKCSPLLLCLSIYSTFLLYILRVSILTASISVPSSRS
jgi:hypothetical protein